MSPRWLSFIRAGCILLALVLFAQLLSTAAAFTNGQAASLVLGQPDFTSNAHATTASGMRIQPGWPSIRPAARCWSQTVATSGCCASTARRKVRRGGGRRARPA